jgi:hypothetical protein
MKAEVRVIHLQAKEYQRLPGNTRNYQKGMEVILSHSLQKNPT